MADEKYINLEDAVDEFQEWLSGAPYWNVSGDDAEKILRSIPAADVVRVVRCKDCRYYHVPTGKCLNIDGLAERVQLSDYCSRYVQEVE